MPRLSENALGYALGNFAGAGTTGQVGTNVTDIATNTASLANAFNPNVSGAVAGDLIAYITKEGQQTPSWQSTDLKVGGLSNVVQSSIQQHQVLKYDAGNWENKQSVEGFTKAEALDASFLADVHREGQVIYLTDEEATKKIAYVSGGKLYGMTATEITA